MVLFFGVVVLLQFFTLIAFRRKHSSRPQLPVLNRVVWWVPGDGRAPSSLPATSSVKCPAFACVLRAGRAGQLSEGGGKARVDSAGGLASHGARAHSHGWWRRALRLDRAAGVIHRAWRGQRSEKLFRVGFEYLYGSDPQYEFVFYNQNRAGIGMWYDY